MAYPITLNTNRVNIGDPLIITSSGGDFSTTVSGTFVYVGGVMARISYQSTNIIHVTIPVGCDSGEGQGLYVYDRVTGIASDTVNISIFYVNEVFDPIQEIVNATRFSQNPLKTMSVYSRDLGYTNYTEINDATSVVQNVLSIVLTTPGERLFRPGFGCGVQNILFTTVSDPNILEKQLLFEIKKQVNIYEPRAHLLLEKSFVEFEETTNSLYIVLCIEVPGGSVKEVGISLSAVKKETYNAQPY